MDGGASDGPCENDLGVLSHTNANFSMTNQRATTDNMVKTINSDLGSWSDALAVCSQQLYANNRSPPPTVSV